MRIDRITIKGRIIGKGMTNQENANPKFPKSNNPFEDFEACRCHLYLMGG
jgi:hypothetical protein